MRDRCRQQARAQIIVLVIVCLVLGFATGAFWHYQATRKPAKPVAPSTADEIPTLSDATESVLQRLQSPVEIRYYALLDPQTTSESLRAFAGRVSRLLTAYQQNAQGMIELKRVETPSDSAAREASADGIRPFNLDKGDACFLGIVLANKDRKETLPRLLPKWEPALEYDLSRIIERLGNPQLPAAPAVDTSESGIAAAKAVRQALPDLENVPLEEGKQELRDTALQEFKNTVGKLNDQLKEAEQQLMAARTSHSKAAEEAATKKIAEIHQAQSAASKRMARDLQDQIAALERLKAEAALAAPAATNNLTQPTTPSR